MQDDLIQTSVRKLEQMFQTATGKEMPPAESSGAAIPLEKNIEKHVGDQIDRLTKLLADTSAAFRDPGSHRPWAPAIDVIEGEKVTTVSVDVPGIPKDALHVTLFDNFLDIEGMRENSAPTDIGCTSFCERPRGTFRRKILMPPGSVPDGMKARLHEGVLEIRVPRNVPSAAMERTIPVE